MHIRRWVLTPLAVALVIASAALTDPVQAQKVDKKVEKAKQEEVQGILGIAEAVAAGQPAPSDITMTFKNDFLKAQDNRTYVPFTLQIPADQGPFKSLAMYLRVVAKPAPGAAAPAPAADAKKKDDKKKGPEYAFEDAYFIDLKTPDAGQPYRVSRAFSVPAGEYDVVVVLREHGVLGEKKDKNAVFKAGYLAQAVKVPDFWNSTLATSTIILAENVEPLAAPLSREELVQQPYTLGMTKITPAASHNLNKKGELSVVFIVYNTQLDPNRKPDVSVEYAFYQKVAGAENGEKFFNKTNPQNFNATTLPPQFDPALGHQLVAGQSIPLASFPEGGYRLEIKVTDKLAGTTVTHNVPFSVAP